MTRVILTDAPNGYSVALATDNGVRCIWPVHGAIIEGGLLEDAIMTAQTVAIDIGADNAQDWQDFVLPDAYYEDGISDSDIKVMLGSCSGYRWQYDPGYIHPRPMRGRDY